jgi:hypothetical protein
MYQFLVVIIAVVSVAFFLLILAGLLWEMTSQKRRNPESGGLLSKLFATTGWGTLRRDTAQENNPYLRADHPPV